MVFMYFIFYKSDMTKTQFQILEILEASKEYSEVADFCEIDFKMYSKCIKQIEGITKNEYKKSIRFLEDLLV